MIESKTNQAAFAWVEKLITCRWNNQGTHDQFKYVMLWSYIHSRVWPSWIVVVLSFLDQVTFRKLLSKVWAVLCDSLTCWRILCCTRKIPWSKRLQDYLMLFMFCMCGGSLHPPCVNLFFLQLSTILNTKIWKPLHNIIHFETFFVITSPFARSCSHNSILFWNLAVM